MKHVKSKTKKRPKTSSKVPETQAIVRVAAPLERPWEFRPEEVVILKNSLAKGSTDKEFEYMMNVARRRRLDPFKNQIWFVKRWDKNADNGQGGSGAYVWTAQTGIDGLLFMAARDHKADFGSVSKPVFGPIVDGHPETATVKVWKRGEPQPTEAEAYWDEYAPADLSKAPFWRKMPRRMLAKCATALAIRQAYPDLGGMYIPEECERMADDYTLGGRQIVAPADQRPSAEATESISILKAKGLWCDEHNCPRNAKHVEQCESSRKAMQKPAIDVPAHPESQPALSWKKDAEKKADEAAKPKPAKKPDPTPIQTKYSLTIDWNLDRNAPVLTGNLEELGLALSKCETPIKMIWGKDELWHAAAKDIPAIMQVASQNAFLVKEIQPNQVPPGGQQSSAPPPARKPTAREGAVTSSAAPAVVSGTIERVNTGMAGKNPVKHVTLLLADRTKPTYSCFDKKWFEHLDAGLGKAARLVTKQNGKYTNIIGALQIGSKEWLEDGTPVIQHNREAGGPTLFNA